MDLQTSGPKRFCVSMNAQSIAGKEFARENQGLKQQFVAEENVIKTIKAVSERLQPAHANDLSGFYSDRQEIDSDVGMREQQGGVLFTD